jgi:hypothetical protein
MTSSADRQVLVGLQAEAGTGVNVDTALRATCSLKPKVIKKHPDEDIGSYAPARHYVVQVMPDGSITLDGNYEQAVVLLAMAMGAVTKTGSEDPYTWAFPLPDVSDDLEDFALFTVEYTDGGDQIIRAVDVFGKTLTISGEAGGSWSFEVELDGGAVTIPAALSATPSAPAVTPIKMADTSLYVDAAWGSIGGTLVEELISFTYKLEGLQHSKQFAGSLSPNGRGNAKWKVSLELVLEMGAAEAHAFADALLTTDQFAVRVGASTNSGDDAANLDGVYMVEDISTLDDRDGNNTIKITLLGEKDSSDNTGNVTLVTNTAAL